MFCFSSNTHRSAAAKLRSYVSDEDVSYLALVTINLIINILILSGCSVAYVPFSLYLE